MARIVVIGGGIAGTAAALALHKAGHEPTVHEAHPESDEDIGAFMTLASNGMRALAGFDAARTVAGVGFDVTRMNVLDAAGAELASVPLGEHDRPLARYRCLRRAQLAAVLRAEARRRGIALRHAARLTGVTETDGAVTARFADGSTADGELLVGADGLRSTVRTWLDPHGPGPAYAGQRVFYGYSDAAPRPAPAPGLITMVRGSAAAFGYLVPPVGRTHWFARVPGPPLAAGERADTAPARWRALLEPLLRPDRTPCADIVAGTGDDLMVTDALHLPPGGRWRSRRTVLIGDAAHAASPATGQGASMALEDALVLAKALRDAPDTDAALARYEHHRRPRTEQNTATSARLTAARPSGDSRTSEDTRRAADGGADEALLRLLDWDTPL
ncbi:FAD-dependent monooxygenase [Kitasatospora sp. NA04385]|uniref:FAD-dependent oxidoreductase n=1 Tax=Kitasatospora sp. NA04385 TaxID=2742135 RepID=UPI0015925577|nr:FAD-dependent monooxygenase [Kitasatospora sp. NA04385]QKW18161.1 FAD-dependent monooxygenase [Kitasatospora sp. NA04385]